MTSTLFPALPAPRVMHRALRARDASYDGVFFTAVKTTRIFCRPSCPARTPAARNVEFFPGPDQALAAGYRPCLRCKPLLAPGETPGWLRPLLRELEQDPGRRVTDAELRQRGLSPERVRRWFLSSHGTTFQAWQRGRRVGRALDELRAGADLTRTAHESGFESLSGFRAAFQGVVGQAPGRARGAVPVRLERLVTPLGPMLAAASQDAVCLLEFDDRRGLPGQVEALARQLGCVVVPGTCPPLRQLARELDEYFLGERREFETPLDAPGTPFQQAAWAALRAIPYGQTRSYAEQAAAIGKPTATRAVARANGLNRLAIVIPCHRVVGSDGQLTGYGGGLWRKKALLELERRTVAAG